MHHTHPSNQETNVMDFKTLKQKLTKQPKEDTPITDTHTTTEEEAQPWWKKKPLITTAVAGCLTSALFFTGWTTHLNDSTYLTRTYGTPGALADGMYSGLDDFFGLKAQIIGDDGHGGKVTYNGRDTVGVTENGLLYAPKPPTEFRNASCDLKPQQNGSEPPKALKNKSAVWWAPTLLSNTQVVQGAQVTPSGFSNNDVTLPAAPNGIYYASGSPLSSNTGSTVLAGHINLNSGALSPWGYLHRLDKCDHMFLTDEHGERHEFAVTGIYLVKQDELSSHSELWRKDGDKKTYFITCSGSSVGTDGTQEVGNTFLFNYEYNLVVETTPVEGSYPKPSPSASVKAPVVTEVPSVATASPSVEAPAPAPSSPEPSVGASSAPAQSPSTGVPGGGSAADGGQGSGVATANPVASAEAPAVARNESVSKSVASNNNARGGATANPAPVKSPSPSPSPSASASPSPSPSKPVGTKHVTKQ